MAGSARPAQWGRVIERPNEEWLAGQAAEPVLDPELPIIDPHHHFWDRRGEGPGHRYLLDELLADIGQRPQCGGDGISRMPLDVPRRRPAGDAPGRRNRIRRRSCRDEQKRRLWQDAGRRRHRRLRRPDLGRAGRAGARSAYPRRRRAVSRGALFGRLGRERHDRQQPPRHGAALYARPDFRARFAKLVNRGLSFDAWLYHPQLGDVVDLARAVPAAPIIVGHVGGVLGYGPYADKRDEVFAAWKRAMIDLAARPNVAVKLGGQMRRLAAFDYGAAETPPSSEELARYWRPDMGTCIELFGAGRCMFESNFPVEKVGTGYAVRWNAFKRIAAGASPDEKRTLFAGTARRFYRLGNTEQDR